MKKIQKAGKSWKQVFAAALAAVTLAAAASEINYAGSRTAHAAIGGSGTSGDPYTIGTAADLAQLAVYINAGTTPWRLPDKYFILTGDIELSGSWTPIGTQSWYFSGNFDGDGHKITGLSLNTASDYQGLFGYINGGTVKNIGLEGTSVKSGGNCIGGVAGYLKNGIVSNCYVTGTVSGTSETGGIAGVIEGSAVISSCYVNGSVNGASSVGGIAGLMNGSIAGHDGGTVQNCYVKGSVSGASLVGGITGRAFGGDIAACYATCEVSGSFDTGGIAGELSSSSVKYSVALNPIISADSAFGRIAGFANVASALANNYAFTEIKDKGGNTVWYNKGLDKIDGYDLTAARALEASFWEETLLWDTDIWYIADGMYPVLKKTGGPQVFKVNFVVSIVHSLDGMSATILITTSGGTLQGQSFAKEGYVFGGLFTDAEMTQAYDPGAEITEDLLLYAKWEKVLAAAKAENIIAGLTLAAAFIFFTAANIKANKKARIKK